MPARPVPDMDKKIEAALENIAAGNSMRKSCEMAGIDKMTFIRHADEIQYARARDCCADMIFWNLIDTAKETRNGKLEPQAARVASDIEKWVVAKMKPRAYGDKVAMELTGKDGGPVQHQDMSKLTDAQLQAILAQANKE